MTVLVMSQPPGSISAVMKPGWGAYSQRISLLWIVALLYCDTPPVQATDAVSRLARLGEQHEDLTAAHAALQDQHERAAARNVTLGGLQVAEYITAMVFDLTCAYWASAIQA